MISPRNDPPPRDPLWARVLLVVAPAIATAVVVEIGTTVREHLARRRDADTSETNSKDGDS